MFPRYILVIDDEPHLCTIIRTCLESLGGWQVAVANSGSAGLEVVQTEPPDAILLDVMLSDMSGLDVLAQLRENEATQNIPVILLTAKALATEQEQYETLQISGIITKPFDPLRLADQIAEILYWK